VRVARPGKLVITAVYLIFTAVLLRTLTNPNIHTRLPYYLGLEFLYLILLTLSLWRPPSKPLFQHLYFIFQSLFVLVLIALRPRFDFIVVLYVLLSLQAVLILSGRARWIWVGISTLLTGLPLMIGLGALLGLSLALMPMTIGLVFASYAAITQEIEEGLHNRQVMLADLQDANRQLTDFASQTEELSAIQERNRLARELHDSVSQTIFSITLFTRSTQLLLERDSNELRPQLERLQSLAQSALAEMRGLIAQMRPTSDESAQRPKP
jgi:signal transduction histidine kinase